MRRVVPVLLLVVVVAVGVTSALAAGSANLLPLGDGKVVQAPRIGWVDSCQSSFQAGGAQVDGPWISGSWWDPSAKLSVRGSVSWPNRRYSLTTNAAATTIVTNDLPSHPTGAFPIQSGDPAYRYDRNPNRIDPQSLTIKLPANPRVAAAPTCLPMGPIGVTTSGVLLFNALDAGGRDAVAHEVQDRCGGHPERSGAYHYHSISACLLEGANGGQHSLLVGYAFDGFPIYGPLGEGGKVLRNSDLDACHGHTHTITWRGRRATMYHYHATAEYPYTLGCYRGTPVRVQLSSEGTRTPEPGNGPPPGGGPPPPQRP